MAVACSDCDRKFDTERGLETHRGKMHDPLPKDRAEELYCRQGLSSKQIARRLDMSHSSVKDRLTEYGLWGLRPANFTLEPADGYPVISRTGVNGKGRRVRVHRLVAIADGADPHDVFSGDYDVDHINGCPVDNRPENLRLLPKGEHGAKDGERSSAGYSHEEYLRALVQEPPEWAQKLDAGDEY